MEDRNWRMFCRIRCKYTQFEFSSLESQHREWVHRIPNRQPLK